MSTGNKTKFLGTVTRIDDPKHLGRVQVHCEAIDGKNTKGEKDWWPVLTSPNSRGPVSPPQVGARVVMHVDADNAAIRYIEFSNVNEKQLSNKAMPGNKTLTALTDEFREKKATHLSGSPKGKIKESTVPREYDGVEKGLPLEPQIEESAEASIKERDETPTIIAAHPEVAADPPRVQNVATATTPFSNVFNPSMSGLLSGMPFGISNLFNMLTDELKSELESKMSPEMMTALQNITSLASNISSDVNPEQFMFDTNRVNPETFASNAVAAAGNIDNVYDLKQWLNKIKTDDSIKDLGSMEPASLSIGSAFGALEATLSQDGQLSINVSDIIQQLISSFLGGIGGIKILGDQSQFQSGSKIPDELLKRMPEETQSQMKAFYEKLNTGPHSKNQDTIKSFLKR